MLSKDLIICILVKTKTTHFKLVFPAYQLNICNTKKYTIGSPSNLLHGLRKYFPLDL